MYIYTHTHKYAYAYVYVYVYRSTLTCKYTCIFLFHIYISTYIYA